MLKVVSCPFKVSVNGIVNSDELVRRVFPANLRVEIVECGSEQREDIKAPVYPSSKSLPFV